MYLNLISADLKKKIPQNFWPKFGNSGYSVASSALH